MAKDKSRLVELRFPVGGLNRQAGFDQQPPYTTPYCQNVRPFDVVNLSSAAMHGMRQRGGARPGLTKFYAGGAQPQNGYPLQMLAASSVLSTAGVASNILLAITNGTLYQNASGAMVAVTGGPQFNTTARQLRGTQVGTKFYIADYRGVGLSGTNGSIASTNRLSDPNISDWTALGINTAKDVVYVAGSVDTEANVFPITSVSATYITITGTMTNQTGNVTWQLGRVPKVFDPSAPTAAIVGLMGSLPIAASSYTTGTVTIAAGVATLTGGSWAGVPAATAANLMQLTVPNVNGIGVRSFAVSVVSGSTSLTLVDTTDDADCTDQQYTLSWASDYYGLPPVNCPLCCTYRGRLVLAGPGAVWYMSRVLNVNDWDYGYDPADPARAVAGTSTTAGGVPDPITALMPHADNYMIFGCESSLWLLNGDPGYGGSITALSREIGVMGPDAWCNLPDGTMVVLSRDGLYQIPPAGQGQPAPLSRSKLPPELLNLDWQNNVVSLAYDLEARGVHIAVTPNAGTAGTHFFYDLTAGGFWPVVFGAAGHQPKALLKYAADATAASRILVGSHDGYLRYYAPTATTDDGTAIVSTVVYGPFRVGGPGFYGEIKQIAGDLDSNGQGVTWGILAGSTAQAAVAVAASVLGGTDGGWVSTTKILTPAVSPCWPVDGLKGVSFLIDGVAYICASNTATTATMTAAGSVATGTRSWAIVAPWTGTWSAGGNHRDFPRAIGAGLCIMVSGGHGWAIEGLRIETEAKGPIR